MLTRDELIHLFVEQRALHIGFLRVLCRDEDLAEELFQDLSVTVINRIDTFTAGSDFGKWVRGIARNLYLNAQRSQSRRAKQVQALDPRLIDGVTTAFDEMPEAEVREHRQMRLSLRQCIERLSDPHRQMLQSRYEQRRSIEEIARGEQRSSGAIMTMLSRIRAALLKCISRSSAAGVG